MTKPRHPTLQVFALPSVRLFLLARFSMLFGRALIAAMLSYHIFAVTDSYAALGILGLVEFAPVIPVSLLGGAVADRFDRRKLLIAAALASGLGAVLLAGLGWRYPDCLTGLLAVAFVVVNVVVADTRLVERDGPRDIGVHLGDAVDVDVGSTRVGQRNRGVCRRCDEEPEGCENRTELHDGGSLGVDGMILGDRIFCRALEVQADRNSKGPLYILGCAEYTVRESDTATFRG